MEREKLRSLLEAVSRGEIAVEEGLELLAHLPFEPLGVACIDHHRSLRKGVPEVVFGQGKSKEELLTIVSNMCQRGQNVLVTRLDPEGARLLREMFPKAEYFNRSRVLMIMNSEPALSGKGKVLVISAGTSDIPVAEEALLTLRFLGNDAEAIYDVGVAGIHRLFAHIPKLREARVIIVVAGMEGALPSLVASLVEVPVIAVPTSVGYGTSFGGIAALLGMLNSCTQGVAVVNIDNGFGAGYLAAIINRP